MIRRETPEVISGARGPRDVRDAQVAEKRASKAALGMKAPAGKIRFQSRYSNLRIQISAPADIRDPFTGRITAGRPKAAQFRNNFFDVAETDEDTLKWLKEHPAYGRNFWLLSDVVEQARKIQVDNVKRQLESDPEFKARVLEALRESNEASLPIPTENV